MQSIYHVLISVEDFFFLLILIENVNWQSTFQFHVSLYLQQINTPNS